MSVLSCLQFVINKALACDPMSQEHLSKLTGKVISIYIQEFDKPIFFSFYETQVDLSWENSQAIDTSLTGTLMDFANIALKYQSDSQLNISGNIHTAEALQKFFLGLSIDWEEELSKMTGDATAHQLAHWIRLFSSQTYNNFTVLQEMIAEYLQQEAHLLPDASEVEAFYSEIDTLKLDTDRLEAKLALLAKGTLA